MSYPITRYIFDVWNVLGELKFRYSFWFIMRLITSSLGLVTPFAVAKIIDHLTDYNGEPRTFYIWLIVIFLANIIALFLRLGSKYQLGRINREAQKTLRLRAMSVLLGHALAWHEEEASGSKIQRINSGANGLRKTLSFLTQSSTDIFIGIIGVGAVFLSMNIKYAVVLLIYVVLYLAYETLLNRKISKKVEVQKAHMEAVSGKLHEYSANITTVKSLGLVRALRSQAEVFEDKLTELGNKVHLVVTKKWWGIQFISAFFFTALLLLVGFDIIGGLITVGSLALFVSYIEKTQHALNKFSSEVDELIDAKHTFFRVLPLLKNVPQEGTRGFPKSWQKIELKNLLFKYKEKEVIDNLNLIICKGDKIGLVGKSGQGKSTLVKLLLNLYKPNKGSITIGGVSLQDLSPKAIADNISIVPQEIELFNQTLKENLTLIPKKKRRLSDAIKLACCDPIVKRLPNGLNTVIGEKGVRLSGGEKQRVGIARALYADPEILILDEATSHLDSVTEEKVLKNLQRLNKTVITIAHRLSTLQYADKIVILDNGKIAEEGSFNQLVKKKGIFFKLYQKQKREK